MQRVFIIRHGERLDNVDYGWVMKSDRPYDPPLTDDGTKDALEAGLRFKDKVCLTLSFLAAHSCVLIVLNTSQKTVTNIISSPPPNLPFSP